MTGSDANILLVNPWIYDFAAYDFWNKPTGLLQIGAILRNYGYQVHLLDCLDRFDPKFLQYQKKDSAKVRYDGTGKFYREIIEKPAILEHVPKNYCRYGFSLSYVEKYLENFPVRPNAILIASGMTYWYPGVKAMVELLRTFFPDTPIILGGVYATLCPEHAQFYISPDYIITGEGEQQVVRLLAEITNGPGADYEFNINDLPYPAFDMYPHLESVLIQTSRGCPFHCSFCASKVLVPHHLRRFPQKVVNELQYWHENYDIHHVAFYDDALLFQADQFFKPILRGIIEKDLNLAMHTPNGLHPRYIDEELADLFFHAGGRTLRLSFESSDHSTQKRLSSKVSNNDLETAVKNLYRAGLSTDNLGVYVIFGLPNQSIDEVKNSVRFVHDLGVHVNPASFSPIPGTREWDLAVKSGYTDFVQDPLLTNNSIYPVWANSIGWEKCEELVHWVREENRKLTAPDHAPVLINDCIH